MLFILIDDKNSGIEEIKYSIALYPAKHQEIELVWYNSFEVYLQAGSPFATAVFLDYHLDKDKTYGSKIVGKINSQYVIGFSTSFKGSERIKQSAISSGIFSPEKIFAISKQNKIPPSEELSVVIHEILNQEK